jgi:hypothetical protein
MDWFMGLPTRGSSLFLILLDQAGDVYTKDIFSEFGPTTAEQSPRIFVMGPRKEVYILFAKGAIVQVLPKSYEMKLIATAPGPIKAGGDYAHGRMFFVSGSHLMSYKIK